MNVFYTYRQQAEILKKNWTPCSFVYIAAIN